MTQLLKLAAATAVGAFLLVATIVVLWPLSVGAAVNAADRVAPIERGVPLRQCITPPMLIMHVEQWAMRTRQAIEVAMFALPDGQLRIVVVVPGIRTLPVYAFAGGCLIMPAGAGEGG